ncbi:MAG: TIGR04423 family type III CRISPR-associated protein [Bacteroidaceae bacterium]|nr:TIGR04423 family type III CRISPR-associated protein [Bacteroidaceae bacterium]
MNKIEINQIDLTASYEGYLWMSDQKEPRVYKDEALDKDYFKGINPFIIEGELYNASQHKSYSIRFVDGSYYVNEYLIEDDEYDENHSKDIQYYLPNRMKDVAALKFLQRWRPESDPLCEDMYVLRPVEQVFVGFKKQLKSKEDEVCQ